MKFNNIEVTGGNFTVTISGEMAEESKVQTLAELGLKYKAEQGALSKLFAGIKDRKSVAFTDESAKHLVAKVTSAVAEAGMSAVNVSVTKRNWSEGANAKENAARTAYDSMILLGLLEEQALKVAQNIYSKFSPVQVQTTFKGMQTANGTSVPTANTEEDESSDA